MSGVFRSSCRVVYKQYVYRSASWGCRGLQSACNNCNRSWAGWMACGVLGGAGKVTQIRAKACWQVPPH
eukprot:scaffold6886_cov113-Skeletonema_dohrnii-CCMP3373.AAC.2